MAALVVNESGGGIRFGLLGPLQVVDGAGAPRVVPAAKQRIVLAALLLADGGTVSAGSLAEALWDASPPPSAPAVMRTYVMRLRRALGPAGTRITGRPAAWAIELNAPGELDLAEVDDLWHAARAAGEAGEWRQASSYLARALGLWRGEPLVDVPSAALARREAGRLGELRLQLTEARIDADLHLGRHGELVADLRRLAAEHPLREHLRVQLMLACYRCGHQAAGLEVYQDARRTLAEELGVEPGRELRDMHQRILIGDPELTAAAPVAAAIREPEGDEPRGARAVAVVPRQLPSSVPHFTGRTAELTRLTELMEEATAQGMSAILVISGMAGAGKTALAVHWAHQVAGQFPSGQLHVNLRGYGPSEKPAAPTQVVRWFLDALGVVKERIPAALDAQAGLYRSLLAGKRMLVVLDNARDEAQVRSLLPGSAGCLVIVTSRNQMPGLAAADGAQLLMLDVLADDDAADLLAARLGLRRVAAEPAALAEIASLCGRLPLALAIAAARAAGRPAHPLTVLAAELRQASDRLDALDAGEATASTRAVFSWSYVQLSAAAARMFRLLGIHPGPDINAAAAVSLAGISPRQTRSALRELTAASLLAEYLPGRYMFHDLLRCYASELACSADSDDDRREAIWRTFDHYLHTANALLAGGWRALELTAAQPRVTPEAIARHDDLAWFEAEHKIMLRLIDLAAADGLGSLPWQLAWTVAGFFDRRGYWHDWAAAQYTALAAARRADDRAGQARACHSLGQACIQLGRYGDGYRHLRRALFLYRQLEYREGQAHVHICRGVAAFRQHRYPEALAAAPQALDLLGSADRSDLRAIVLNEVGYGYAIKGDYNEALFWCAQARDLYHELGARFGEADAWDSMAQTHQRLGHYSQAIDCYQRAQRLHSGNRYAYGQTSLRLGDAYQAAGNVAAARDAWQQALTTFDDLHHADAKLVRAKLHSPRQL